MITVQHRRSQSPARQGRQPCLAAACCCCAAYGQQPDGSVNVHRSRLCTVQYARAQTAMQASEITSGSNQPRHLIVNHTVHGQGCDQHVHVRMLGQFRAGTSFTGCTTAFADLTPTIGAAMITTCVLELVTHVTGDPPDPAQQPPSFTPQWASSGSAHAWDETLRDASH